MAENGNDKGPVKASPGSRPTETFSTNNTNASRRSFNDRAISESTTVKRGTKVPPKSTPKKDR